MAPTTAITKRRGFHRTVVCLAIRIAIVVIVYIRYIVVVAMVCIYGRQISETHFNDRLLGRAVFRENTGVPPYLMATHFEERRSMRLSFFHYHARFN